MEVKGNRLLNQGRSSMSDKIIKSYQELCREIEIWESRDRAYQAEIQALNQLANIYGPSGVSGIDYSKDRVQSSSHIGFERSAY